MKPRVSILIPCHNAELWVGAAVRSALAQTWEETEVIVIDDGSTDASPRILAGFADRAKVVCRGNQGGNPTRNELLAQASGEWVQFLDADDYLLPDKIERQMAVVDASADVVYAPLIVENLVDGKVTRAASRQHAAEQGHDPWAYHLHWNLTQTGGALFRRSTLTAVGGWNEAQSCCQDNELFFRLLQHGARFVHCEHAGAVYRRFADSTVSTRNGAKVRREIIRLLAAAEEWLKDREEWTPRRQRAANDYRFGLARQLWPEDPAAAEAIMDEVNRSQPGFRPSPGPHAPTLYQLCYRWFGFSGAERISALRRRVKGSAA
jgi:glycosyltransferase involved in cell wall biosynthesis